MKKILLAFLLCVWAMSATAQTDLYIIYDPAEPVLITKDIRKNLGIKSNLTPRYYRCRMLKGSNGGRYILGFRSFTGEDLKLRVDEDRPIQTVPATQLQVLGQTHHVRTPLQLDADVQPAIDYEYQHGYNSPSEAPTVVYFESFRNIYVVEYVGSNVKITPVTIDNTFE